MNLYQEAKRCFLVTDPDEKVDRSLEIIAAMSSGTLEWEEGEVPEQLASPGRPQRPLLVPPGRVPRRGFRSETQRAALIHALTHIELTAVDLAWDCIYRYRGMPKAYYRDWITAAGDEARHFRALRDRLRAMGYDYGDFAAHNELWGNAARTAGDLKDRMAVVHRVLEARALDVVPRIRKRFEEQGDRETAAILAEIANDEIAHVGAGSRWFRYRCQREGVEPEETFFKLVLHYLGSHSKGPFNIEARRRAGFSEKEIERLQDYDPAGKAANTGC